MTEMGERARKGHPVRGVARPGPFEDRGRHTAAAPIRPIAADDPRRFGFQTPLDAMLFQLDDGLAAVNELIELETGTAALAFELSLGTWLVGS